MNNIFKVVFNKSLGRFTVVSELAKGETKASSNVVRTEQASRGLRFSTLFSALVMGLGLSSVSMAAIQISGTNTNGTITSTTAEAGEDLTRVVTDANGGSVTGVRGIAIGYDSDAREYVEGTTATLTGRSSGIALGDHTRAVGALSMAIGHHTIANKEAAIAFGVAARAAGTDSLAMMRQAAATGSYSIGIGTAASSTADSTIALGRFATADNEGAIAIGSATTTGATYTAADATIASGKNSLAVGNKATTGAQAERAIALGSNTKAQAVDSIAVGSGNTLNADASKSGVLGNANNISQTGSYAIGNTNTINVANTFVVGNSVTPTQANSVILGSNSTDRPATTEIFATVGSLTYSGFAGQGSTTQGVVSVGSVGNERQIINVAAGEIEADSTDAINGSQLFATNNVLDTLANSMKTNLGSAATLANTGAITVNNLGGTGKSTVHEAIAAARNEVEKGTNIVSVDKTIGDSGQAIYTVNAKGSEVVGVADGDIVVTPATDDTTNVTTYTLSLSDAVKASIANANKGWRVHANGDAGANVAPGDTVKFLDGSNILITRTDKNITVGTKQDVTFDTVAAKNITVGPVTINETAGINAGGLKITNVEAGEAPTDAVNVSQLQKETEKFLGLAGNMSGFIVQGNGTNATTIGNDGKVNFVDGNGTVAKVTGTTNGTNIAYDLNAATLQSLAKANSAIQEVITQIDGAQVKTIGQSDKTANFLTGKNIKLSPEGGGIKIATSDNVTFTTVAADKAKVGNVTINPDNTVGGLSNKTWTSTTTPVSGRAATEDQLKAAIDSIDLSGKGSFALKGDDGLTASKSLNNAIEVKGKGGLVTSVKDNALHIGLSNDLTIGDTTAPGTVTVKGENGQDGVTLNGAEGSIGLTGQDGTSATIGVKAGSPGVDGTSAKPRLTVGNEEVATLNDGLKFGANDGKVHGAKMNSTVNIKGAAANTNWDQFDKGQNIMTQVVDNTITVALAKDLKGLNSATFGSGANQFKVDGSGVKFVDGSGNPVAGTPSISRDGIDGGNKQLTGVASGLGDTKLADATGAVLTNAANVGDLKNAVQDVADEVQKSIDGGFSLKAEDGTLVNKKLGQAIDVVGANSNITTSVKDNKLQIQLSNNLDLGDEGSVKMGDTLVNADGVKVGNVSVTADGINAGGNKVSGVANGDISANSTDAINGGQLYTVQDNLNKKVDAAKTEVEAGDNVVVTERKGNNGQSIYTVKTEDDVNFKRASVGDVVMDSTTNKITGLADGEVSANSKDAVTGGQLNTATRAIKEVDRKINQTTRKVYESYVTIEENTKDISKIDGILDKGLNYAADKGPNVARQLGEVMSFTGDENIVTETTGDGINFKLSRNLKVDSISVNNGPSITDKGMDANNKPITNLASGLGNVYENPEDNNGASVGDVKSIVDGKNKQQSQQIKRAGRDADAGTASAMAAAGLPQAYLPGHSMVALAAGGYRGEGATAVGVSRISDNGKVVLKLQGAVNGKGYAGGSAGVGYQW